MKRIVMLLSAAALVLVPALPARADATAFIGATTTPSNRLTKGFALGAGVLVIGFEFEYASTVENTTAGAPSLKTGMGNVLLQTPVALFGFQPYFTTGAGFYRETLDDNAINGFGKNVGGGVKVSLAGPIRLRVDYRVFTLGDKARATPAHRVYAGLNLGF
jgi:hypothetical protein